MVEEQKGGGGGAPPPGGSGDEEGQEQNALDAFQSWLEFNKVNIFDATIGTLRFGTPVDVTISSNAITVTSSSHNITAAGTLNTIEGWDTSGMMVLLTADDTVTIAHAADNITCWNDTNVTLDAGDLALLFRPDPTADSFVCIGDVFGTTSHARAHNMTGTSDHDAGNWKVFYSDGSGDVQELALGADGEVLTGTGASSAPAFQTADTSHAHANDHASGSDNQNLFSTIAGDSGTNPVADAETDTLTIAGGTGITTTGDSSTDTITIAADNDHAESHDYDSHTGGVPFGDVEYDDATSDPLDVDGTAAADGVEGSPARKDHRHDYGFDDATSDPVQDGDTASDGAEGTPARKDHRHPKHHAKYTDAEAISAVEGEATLDLAGDVTIDGAKSLQVDVIDEKDAGAGVTIDGTQVKDNGIVFVEAADHPITPAATKGQIWVKNAAPNELWFTDDAGTDTQLGAGGGSGTMTTVKHDGSQVGGADIVTLDFGEGLAVTESPDTEINVSVEKASTTNEGMAELATAAETTTGTAADRVVTPDGLAGSDFGKRLPGVMLNAPDGDALTTGDGKAVIRIPAELEGYDLIDVAMSCTTPSTSGIPTVQLRRSRRSTATTRAEVDILSTKVTIDANEYDSNDAATAPVINTSNDDMQEDDQILFDVDVAGTGTKGVYVHLAFGLP